MPLGNPTPLRQEMYLANLARRTPGFRINQFLKQYFLSQYELAARGYERLSFAGQTEKGFDGFISKNECSISNGRVIAVCMINPVNRVSFGARVAKDVSYFASFWCLRTHKQIGGASLNPDCLLLEVKRFPTIVSSYKLYEGSTKTEGAEDYETFVPIYDNLAEELNDTGSELFPKRKAACYPVMISKGFELIKEKGLRVSNS